VEGPVARIIFERRSKVKRTKRQRHPYRLGRWQRAGRRENAPSFM